MSRASSTSLVRLRQAAAQPGTMRKKIFTTNATQTVSASVATWVTADPCRDLASLAVQDLAGLGGDPFLGGGLVLVEEGPGLPQVFDVDEVDDDCDRDAAGRGPGGDGLDLGVVAVDENDRLALVAGVAALGLVKGRRDDGGDVVGDRGGQPLARACGSRGFCSSSVQLPVLSSCASARGC